MSDMTKERTYLGTHPWISFKIDSNRFDYKLWMALGEVKSKCDHIAGIPLQPEVQQDLHSLYLAKGVHATTAIEGNTLSEQEVLDRIEGKLALPPSREYLGKETDNIVNGCNQIAERLLKGGPIDLSFEEVNHFNTIVLSDLKLEDEVIPGAIRKHSVGVGRYRGAPPEDCEYLLIRMCEWLNQEDLKQQDNFLVFGVLRAILAHLYIAWIHPYGDGNGRTARLLEFKILLSHGVSSAAAHLLSNHYNLTRDEYYRQLDYASKSGGDVIPFVAYAVQGFIDGLKEQIDRIRAEQLRIMWRDFVYESFKNKSGSVNERKRKLVLDMSNHFQPIPFKEIRRVSPRIAELYAGKTERAIRRDVNDLLEMDLVKRSPKGFEANRQKVRAFLPPRKVN
jgi:Fic family protein